VRGEARRVHFGASPSVTTHRQRPCPPPAPAAFSARVRVFELKFFASGSSALPFVSWRSSGWPTFAAFINTNLCSIKGWMMTSLLSYRPQSTLQNLGQSARGCVPSALDALANSSAADFNDLAGDFVIFSQDDKARHDGLEAGTRSATLPRLYQRPGQPCFVALGTGSVRATRHKRISDNSL
jgi:hypothetical protein